ncbi:HdeD family acid-resistance protein [Breznakiella homolactica]|uniref:DUF308 domain-containing protein n=1 Tax=Breznakiella homolactica TaxID=2798577 RepID=A0A7T7XR73_9SPIR|nr:DUF308 domain-containing protein [Breznakiella homolactica]QQO10973.1 DUF308 domain-containing protein [Breznakiella homolactica]
MKRRSTFGWIELILGILLIVLGILTFRNPVSALGSFVVIYGIAAIVSGIADIVLYVRLQRRTGFGPATAIISGILSILVGILLLFNINAGVFAFSFLFPIWFIVHCIARLSNLPLIRAIGGNGAYWWSMIINILGLILGIVLLFNPFASALSMVYLIGIYLVVLGIGSIVTAFSRLGQGR